MPAADYAERRVAVPAGEKSEPQASAPAPYDEDGVLDGWVASLTPDRFERALAALARTRDAGRVRG